ncbi:sugar kinase [Kaistia dalseonensis]|uniref:N-acetylglucosamine kinase-like BadF-type ATPase n=1 Tax=Kaistia dalseonensis TaxID=410840 RepID=A0ABU0HCJ8_9HYPH|nr:BadF/BadG/BcrA/BcrD ATPase family protein [Kaistia dalseonensis]MCX5496962.1 sugar kinase [Kaistia dalseonensis]MDQ0439588.1 N-acetylglucosamine kinase-like BadF-type ATPase [Kaistia dalseonensis]
MTLASAEMPLIVGIDIGGTKTHLRAESVSDGPARDLVVPSHEWRTRDWDRDAVRLLDMVARFVEGAPVAAIGIGAHGCDDAAECEAFRVALAARTATPLSVVNDAELMPLALGLAEQIGVVAGTGSIAVCRPSPQQMLVAGGWGWIIGDEGSASGLVREAVRAVARHFDAGGSRREPLVEAIFETLQVPSVPRLGSTLSELRSAATVGRHATAVFQAAEAGSTLAATVIREGGRALAQLAALLEARGAGARHAVAGGSVIAAQPLLWQAFAAELAEASAGRIAAHLFTGSPVEGACRLAASLAQSPAGDGMRSAAALS